MSANGIQFDPSFPYWLPEEYRHDDLPIEGVLKKHKGRRGGEIPASGRKFNLFVDGFKKLLGPKAQDQYQANCEKGLGSVRKGGTFTGNQYWLWVAEKNPSSGRIESTSTWAWRCHELHRVAGEIFKEGAPKASSPPDMGPDLGQPDAGVPNPDAGRAPERTIQAPPPPPLLPPERETETDLGSWGIHASGLLTLGGALTQKFVSFAHESVRAERWFGSGLQQWAGRFMETRRYRLLHATTAPLGMAVMAFNAARALGRIMDQSSQDRTSDWIMIGGAGCGLMALMGSFNPLFRGLAATAGLTLDAIDLCRLATDWQEERVSFGHLLVQGGLTMLFGLDRESRMAMRGLLPRGIRMSGLKPHANHVYSAEEFRPAVAAPDSVADHAVFERSLSSVVREGTIDLRNIRLVHCLAEGDGSGIVGRKLYDMRQVLTKWKREKPFTWKLHRKKIMEEMLRGDSGSKEDLPQVAIYLDPTKVRQMDLLLANGQRRIATLTLLAARGEIPLSWLTDVPVYVHAISRAQDIGGLTSRRDLPHGEVFAEAETAPRSHWYLDEAPSRVQRRVQRGWGIKKLTVRKKKSQDPDTGKAVTRDLVELEFGIRRSPAEALNPLDRVQERVFQQKPWLEVTTWQTAEAALIFRLVRERVIPEEDFFRVMAADPIFRQRVFDEGRLTQIENQGWFSRYMTALTSGRANGSIEDALRPLWLEAGEVRGYLDRSIGDGTFHPDKIREVLERGYDTNIFSDEFKFGNFVRETNPDIRITTVALSKFEPIEYRLHFLLRLAEKETNEEVLKKIRSAIKAATVEATRMDPRDLAKSQAHVELWGRVRDYLGRNGDDPDVSGGWRTLAEWVHTNANAALRGALDPNARLFLTSRETQTFSVWKPGQRGTTQRGP